MNVLELADLLADSNDPDIRRAVAMLRSQQEEIEGMRTRFTLAFWHDTFVEVKKPNSDLIYRFKLDETNDS